MVSRKTDILRTLSNLSYYQFYIINRFKYFYTSKFWKKKDFNHLTKKDYGNLFML